ncbi:MAG: hypothetical protein JSR46_05635, partial [Verrucomicrobia bacterium]|nr:hypothetical protein [Verrucomicrobiota bacterium]
MNSAEVSHLSLEERFLSYWDLSVDSNRNDFEDYLEPNEWSPEGIIPHLQLAEKEIIVSTGTERTLFALLFGTFEGMVGIDINHRVKAYNDFNLLLLRIAKTRKEYIDLSQPTKDIEGRVAIIREKMVGNLPERVQRYYQRHLVTFASVYLTQKHAWRSSIEFGKCKYHESDEQFSKLQDYARSGKIIYIIGDINKLNFLGEAGVPVSVVDASNIHDYSILNFKFGCNRTPRIIVTLAQFQTAKYASFVHDLSREESDELDRQIELINSSMHNFNVSFMKLKFKADLHLSQDLFNAGAYSTCSKKTLEKVKNYVNSYILSIPGLPTYNMIVWPLRKINDTPPEQLETLANHVAIKRFVKYLVQPMAGLTPAVYMAFSKVEGWKEAVEAHFAYSSSQLNELVARLQEANLLDTFIQEFGQERLSALMLKAKE